MCFSIKFYVCCVPENHVQTHIHYHTIFAKMQSFPIIWMRNWFPKCPYNVVCNMYRFVFYLATEEKYKLILSMQTCFVFLFSYFHFLDAAFCNWIYLMQHFCCINCCIGNMLYFYVFLYIYAAYIYILNEITDKKDDIIKSITNFICFTYKIIEVTLKWYIGRLRHKFLLKHITNVYVH